MKGRLKSAGGSLGIAGVALEVAGDDCLDGRRPWKLLGRPWAVSEKPLRSCGVSRGRFGNISGPFKAPEIIEN